MEGEEQNLLEVRGEVGKSLSEEVKRMPRREVGRGKAQHREEPPRGKQEAHG